MNWKRLLAYITGSVDQELLLRNEFLVTENRILKNQIKGQLQLTDLERISLAEIGKRLAGWRRQRWRRSFDRKRFSGGTGSCLQRSSTVQSSERPLAVLRPARRSRSWY